MEGMWFTVIQIEHRENSCIGGIYIKYNSNKICLPYYNIRVKRLYDYAIVIVYVSLKS